MTSEKINKNVIEFLTSENFNKKFIEFGHHTTLLGETYIKCIENTAKTMKTPLDLENVRLRRARIY